MRCARHLRVHRRFRPPGGGSWLIVFTWYSQLQVVLRDRSRQDSDEVIPQWRRGGREVMNTRTRRVCKDQERHPRGRAATNYIRKAVQRGRGTAVASRLGDVVMVDTHDTVAVIVPSHRQRRAPPLPNISTFAADLGQAWKLELRRSVWGSHGICILRITYECAERGTDAVAMT